MNSNFIHKVNKWDKYVEKILNENKIKCNKNSLLHSYDSKYYTKLNTKLNISNIIITAFSSIFITAINSLANVEDNIKQIVVLISCLFLMISSIINTLQQSFNFEKKAETHNTSANKFIALENNIKRLLNLEESIKITSLDFFKLSQIELDNLIESSPEISDLSKKLYDTELEKDKIDDFDIENIESVIENEVEIQMDNINNEISDKSKIDYAMLRFIKNTY